ncbi:unnamed protein product [Rotaria magnacalcarata]|uniref:Uncharacterized protein n=2 Tax=Rotaria magnacalcarata TaxID=392030 RepID=A0A819Y696_9BILA|nr:unnamed protein product [Rotaria magnacalcarata]
MAQTHRNTKKLTLKITLKMLISAQVSLHFNTNTSLKHAFCFQVTSINSHRQSTPLPLNNDSSLDIQGINDLDKTPSLVSVEDEIDEIVKNGHFHGEPNPFDELNDWLSKEIDNAELKSIDALIQERTMSFTTQPPTNIRRRYQSEGKRQVEKSRSKPAAIMLPNLKNVKLNPNQSFWIQLGLITTTDNPANNEYIHVNRIRYHSNDISILDDEFVRIPLCQMDIQGGIKRLPHLSIIKVKLDEYRFVLKPFNPSATDNPVEIYENNSKKSLVAKAKIFREEYNLTSSRIVCQLLIKQNATWHTTNIMCRTDIMNDLTKSNKSAATIQLIEDEDDYPSSSRKRERSPSLEKGLPVNRIKTL